MCRRNISIGIPLNLSKEVKRGTEVERSDSYPADLRYVHTSVVKTSDIGEIDIWPTQLDVLVLESVSFKF